MLGSYRLTYRKWNSNICLARFWGVTRWPADQPRSSWPRPSSTAPSVSSPEQFWTWTDFGAGVWSKPKKTLLQIAWFWMIFSNHFEKICVFLFGSCKLPVNWGWKIESLYEQNHKPAVDCCSATKPSICKSATCCFRNFPIQNSKYSFCPWTNFKNPDINKRHFNQDLSISSLFSASGAPACWKNSILNLSPGAPLMTQDFS